MPNFQIKIPGTAFKESMDAMRLRLAALVSESEAVPFDLFFNYFALTNSNEQLGLQLRDRGSLSASSANTYQNDGNIIAEIIRDIGPEHRELTLFMGQELVVTHNVNGGDLNLEFRSGDIILGVDQLPEELGYGTSFLLKRIVWDTSGAHYFAHEDGLPENAIEIFVDVTLSEPAFLNGLRGLPSRPSFPLMVPLRIAEGGCCGGGFQVKDPPLPTGPRCVNLHAKLVTLSSVNVSGLVAAMNDIFRTREVTVHLASVQNLNLPEFRDLEVGRCVSNQYTAEQARLYRDYRGQAGSDDICAFWVDSLTSASGNTIGCAAHPPGIPSLALIAGGTPWLLAHEVGHVVGLTHVNDSDNLMRPVDSFTNPPPDLNPGQGNTMRWSRLMFPC